MSAKSDEAPSDLIRARDVGGFDVWSLPSFDPHVPEPEPEPEEELPEMEEVPLEEVQPLTLEEVESIRQEAYNEGFAVGEKEGFHSTTLKVRQEADVALTAKLRALESLMLNLFDPIAEQDTQIEKSLVGLVQHIAKQVIQRELAIDSSQIEHVMREALKLLPLGVGNVRLYINPQDFELVKALRERHEETWRIVEDAALLPGGCRVETEHSRIDATVETRISQIMAKLFDQLHEQALHPAAADLSLELPDEPPVSADAAPTDAGLDVPELDASAPDSRDAP
ncbi:MULTISPECIES: flagellar assembly protein FliH [Pseudomonas]|jgi:flagellar assembly protein FliH|uniref:flagellar assembly protein FliH n=1 Tax=Pseudomonas TaxID=286 RepID=UPI000D6AD761|nr:MULTISPECIES: flagellar assembly protein FliH [Pseudomonas]AXP02054.1 flagellar assembly protein FliH [Pseudomonas fluorescens]PWJ41165.1 flagellar assembly protein FliH [Pseudomonas sp. 43mfcvi1.1]UQI32675.1 flagellar assembly protein FliH [Pseudomonas bijieensis]WLH64477.1 flagellar assembly protein FliH [Pseudomonas sp. FP2300]SSB94318.1 flagellar assembly protein FliH [Pseudomonas sp. 43mfcvi1.1]